MVEVLRFFFSLLRSTLWGSAIPARELTRQQYAQLMNLARKQTVEGLIAHALACQDNGIRLDRQDVFDLIKKSQRIAIENKRVDSVLTLLVQLLNHHDIPFVVVKGQTIASLMTHPETRSPGDIDFYIPPTHFDQARDIIANEWNATFEHDDEEGEQHLAFSHNGVLLEMHFCLLAFASKRNQRVFDSMIDVHGLSARTKDEYVDGDKVPTLSPEVNLVYTFLHLYHHLVELGCGLRQFCDVAVLCHTYHTMESFDSQLVVKYLEDMDFAPAFRAVETILCDYIGMPEEECPLPFTDKDRRYAKDIMNIVFLRGNFGKYGRKSAVRSGLHYYIEQTSIKLQHYRLFYHLSRREVLASTFLGIPRKVIQALMRR